MEKEKIKMLAVFNGLNTKKDGIHVIKFKIPFREIASYMQTVRMIGANFNVGVKRDDLKVILTRSAMLYKLSIDSDGEATLTIEAEDIEDNFNPKQIIDKVINLVLWEES